jgi:hypothetical protein
MVPGQTLTSAAQLAQTSSSPWQLLSVSGGTVSINPAVRFGLVANVANGSSSGPGTPQYISELLIHAGSNVFLSWASTNQTGGRGANAQLWVHAASGGGGTASMMDAYLLPVGGSTLGINSASNIRELFIGAGSNITLSGVSSSFGSGAADYHIDIHAASGGGGSPLWFQITDSGGGVLGATNSFTVSKLLLAADPGISLNAVTNGLVLIGTNMSAGGGPAFSLMAAQTTFTNQVSFAQTVSAPWQFYSVSGSTINFNPAMRFGLASGGGGSTLGPNTPMFMSEVLLHAGSNVSLSWNHTTQASARGDIARLTINAGPVINIAPGPGIAFVTSSNSVTIQFAGARALADDVRMRRMESLIERLSTLLEN